MTGCKYHDYHLTKEDGHYYIQYDIAPNANKQHFIEYFAPNYPFRSVKEMKDTIINGSFTQEQHDYLIKALSNINGRVYVFDIDDLHEATYPTDLDMTLYFHGGSYSWRTNKDDDDSLSVSMYFTSEEIFASNRDLEDSLRSSKNTEVTSVTTTEDRDATIIDYIRFNGDVIKAIIYTIETDEKTLGDALKALNIIEGDDSEFGIYIKKTNGIVADYDIDASWWGFNKVLEDGTREIMLSGVDSVDIVGGEVFELIYSK